jgi:hypothetical protein
MFQTFAGPTEDHEHLRVILNWFGELESTFAGAPAAGR